MTTASEARDLQLVRRGGAESDRGDRGGTAGTAGGTDAAGLADPAGAAHPTGDAARPVGGGDPSPTGRRVPWRLVVAATATIGLVCGVRAGTQLAWGQVTGLDTGNWLAFGHQWLGDDLAGGTGSTYPPVVPVLVALVEAVAGPLAAVIAAGVVASVVHAGCVVAVLWRAGCGWWSLPPAVTVVSGTAVGEALAWGGLPQVLGLGLGLLAMYLLAELLVRPRADLAWAAGAVLLAVGATSHLVLAEVVAVAGIMALLRLTSPLPRPSWRRARALALVGARVAAPSLLLVPMYLRLLSTVGGSVADRRDSQSLAEFLGAVDLTIRELPELWRPANVFCLVLPLLLLAHRRRPIWLVTAGLGVFLAGVAALNPEPRFAYLVPLVLVAGFGLLVAHGPRLTSRRLGVALAAVALAAMTTSTYRGLVMFEGQVAYYGRFLPEGTMTALDDLRATTAPWDLVAVPPVAGMPFGWWVEGYGRRPAVVGSSASWLNFPEERERAAVSVRLFSASDVFSDEWFAVARAEGIDVVYVPGAYDVVPPEVADALRADRPELVLHDSSAALIVEVP